LDPVAIRHATPADGALIAAMIAEHAGDEGIEAIGQADGYASGLAERAFACLLAEGSAGALGLAMFYPTFSSWAGRPGLFLEDLYVRPPARGLGVGRLLLAELARIARQQGATRIDLAVHEGNQACGLYAGLGLRQLPGWLIWRADGAALAALAANR
jgi:GNAT superfamily N-acetyltransferase